MSNEILVVVGYDDWTNKILFTGYHFEAKDLNGT